MRTSVGRRGGRRATVGEERRVVRATRLVGGAGLVATMVTGLADGPTEVLLTSFGVAVAAGVTDRVRYRREGRERDRQLAGGPAQADAPGGPRSTPPSDAGAPGASQVGHRDLSVFSAAEHGRRVTVDRVDQLADGVSVLEWSVRPHRNVERRTGVLVEHAPTGGWLLLRPRARAGLRLPMEAPRVSSGDAALDRAYVIWQRGVRDAGWLEGEVAAAVTACVDHDAEVEIVEDRTLVVLDGHHAVELREMLASRGTALRDALQDTSR